MEEGAPTKKKKRKKILESSKLESTLLAGFFYATLHLHYITSNRMHNRPLAGTTIIGISMALLVNLLSFVGSGFFSSVSVFFSFVLSNWLTSDRSGLSAIVNCKRHAHNYKITIALVFSSALATIQTLNGYRGEL